MDEQKKENNRVNVFISYFQNNKVTSLIIVFGIILIGFDRVSESGENILRRIGIIRKYNISETTNRGQFSSQLIENAWNRIFWMRVYTERVRLNASQTEQQEAYQKYIDASEIWSSRIMNYYIGLDEYYPLSNKRETLEGVIQKKFITIGDLIRNLKYQSPSMTSADVIRQVDTIQQLIEDVNFDFYSLVDQPIKRNS